MFEKIDLVLHHINYIMYSRFRSIFEIQVGQLRSLIISKEDFKRSPKFNPITFTFNENSNFGQESLLDV